MQPWKSLLARLGALQQPSADQKSHIQEYAPEHETIYSVGCYRLQVEAVFASSLLELLPTWEVKSSARGHKLKLG
jgi:hypothetical protein